MPLLSRRIFVIGRLVECTPELKDEYRVVSSTSVVQLRLGRRFALTPGAQMLMATGSWAWLGSDRMRADPTPYGLSTGP